jgi:hypothetical protein
VVIAQLNRGNLAQGLGPNNKDGTKLAPLPAGSAEFDGARKDYCATHLPDLSAMRQLEPQAQIDAPSQSSPGAQSESCQQELRASPDEALQIPAFDVAPEHTAPTQASFRTQSWSL